MHTALNTLLVDDNAEVRQALREFLHELGHQVTEAANGEEGWELWRAPGAGFNALVSDFSMPGICGVTLSERIRQHDPKAAIVLVSSQRDNPDLLRRVARGDVVFLHKPFTPLDLDRALRGAADNTTPRVGVDEKPITPAPVAPMRSLPHRPPPSVSAHRAPARGQRVRASWRLPAAAAMVVALASTAWLFYPTSPELPAPPIQTVRRSSEIVGLSPTGQLDSVPHSLHWESFPGASAYRCTIYGVDETVLWQGRSTEPSVELPQEIRSQLGPGVSYYWRTEALTTTGGRLAASRLVRIDLALATEPNPEEIR